MWAFECLRFSLPFFLPVIVAAYFIGRRQIRPWGVALFGGLEFVAVLAANSI